MTVAEVLVRWLLEGQAKHPLSLTVKLMKKLMYVYSLHSVNITDLNISFQNLGAEQDDAGPEISDPEQQNLVFVNNEQEKGYDNENMETVISVGSLEAERSQDSGKQ